MTIRDKGRATKVVISFSHKNNDHHNVHSQNVIKQNKEHVKIPS